tara:strand:+ start:1571 stop:2527 length:957 start_codon:yes stop_codon:yes gene_type:complete
MNCPICQTNIKSNFRCDYKFEIHEDKKYFGDLKIDRCEECNFSYANPMPKNDSLDFFYENIYRLPYRPPYWISENEQDIEKKFLLERNLNYLLYLSTLIDLKKVENIYDFGAGIGDLGYVIKKKFPNVNLFCTEYDKHCLNILKKRGYNNGEIKKIDKKFDLIITTHSLEHLTDVEVFSKFYEILKPGGYLFFEIPYCPEEYFSGRPYDGPHLLFYTKKSIEKISEKYNFDIFRIDTSMYSFNEDYRNQKKSQDRYYKIQSGLTFNIKQFVKKFIPKSILKLREKLVDIKNVDEMQILGSYTSNSGDNTYLRGILKKK